MSMSTSAIPGHHRPPRRSIETMAHSRPTRLWTILGHRDEGARATSVPGGRSSPVAGSPRPGRCLGASRRPPSRSSARGAGRPGGTGGGGRAAHGRRSGGLEGPEGMPAVDPVVLELPVLVEGHADRVPDAVLPDGVDLLAGAEEGV